MLDFSHRGYPETSLAALCQGLLFSSGEASGIAAGERILNVYSQLSPEDRLSFFELLHEQFGIDADEAFRAVEKYRDTPTAAHMKRLQSAVEPRRQELLRRINLAPSGTTKLVHMREQLLEVLGGNPALKEVDMDFLHLFQSWFNRGFLELRRIDWQTPAAVLEKIIKYEAVHQIDDWDELRRRINPPDRRLYAFFHPRLADEPLIFVEVALAKDVPSTIESILADDREIVPLEQARTAVFYSISNCQTGLRGVSFGNFLIKQVVEDLRRELPSLKTFVTLSPVPKFAHWLAGVSASQPPELQDLLATVADINWADLTGEPSALARYEPAITRLAAYYLIKAKSESGAPLDPVARFHIGNGARLERINWRADLSLPGRKNGHGIMVNYLYRLDEIERNHEMFATSGTISTSNAVAGLVKRSEAANVQGALA